MHSSGVVAEDNCEAGLNGVMTFTANGLFLSIICKRKILWLTSLTTNC